MSVPIPLSSAYVIVVAGIPGVLLLGYALAFRSTGEKSVAQVLAPGFGVATWVLCVHFVAKLALSFGTGLWLGTLICSILGLAGWQISRDRAETESSRPIPWAWMIFGSLLAAAMIAPTALFWSIHDELFMTGHMSIAAQIQNDIYPPRNMTFPEFELSYHYGFSLLVAMVSTIFRLQVPQAIDAVTISSFGYTFALLWVLGNRLMANRLGWLTGLLGLFGGGIGFFGVMDREPWVFRLLGFGEVEGQIVNPPLVSYFFQHPWTVGMPLLSCVAILLSTRATGLVAWRYVSFALLLAALSLGQIVLFASAAPLVAIAELRHGGRVSWRHGLAAFAAVVSALVIAKLAGGFFAQSNSSSHLTFRLGPGETLWGAILWNLQSFGFLLPFGIIGLALLQKNRVFYAGLAAGGLLILNFVSYQQSWDIAKFATVGTIGLAVGASVAIGRLMSTDRRVVAYGLAGVATLSCVAGGVTFAASMALELDGIPYVKRPSELEEADVAVIAWLRPRVQAGEVVYRRLSSAHGYAQWGGLAQVWPDAMVARFGFSQERLVAREQLLVQRPAELDRYLAEGIHWMVLDIRDGGDARLRALAARWANEERAQLVLHHGPLMVIRLGTAPTGAVPMLPASNR